MTWNSSIWDCSIALRHGFLMWLISLNRLPMQVLLLSYHRISEGACSYCQRRPDSIDHLFFGCAITGTLARFWVAKCNLSWRNVTWQENLRWAIRFIGDHNFPHRIACFSLGTLCHIIWTERNHILFRNWTLFSTGPLQPPC